MIVMIRRYNAVRIVLGLLLLAAAGLKLYGLGVSAVPPPDQQSAEQTASPPEPLNFTLDHPPILANDSPVTTFDIPVTNQTAEPVTFGLLRCQCSCSESELPKQSLAPHESMTV
ncbi:MAG: hypothetical protein WD472_02255, partial [Dehalococcoidia bacterium]